MDEKIRDDAVLNATIQQVSKSEVERAKDTGDRIAANLNMKIIWRLALKYSMLREDSFHLSIIPEE
jgi:hypothetical protein